MVDPYLIRSLKRVHDQASETLEVTEPTSSEAIAERFNEVLEDFQDEYTEKERLQEIDPIDGIHAGITRPRAAERANEDLRKIKLRTESIADMFDLDVADFQDVDDTGEIQPIIIEQHTEVEQETEVDQTVEFTQLIDQVDQAMLSNEESEELKDIIQEFESAIEDGDADEDRLRDLLTQAKGIGAGVGTQVAAQLTMAGLRAGYDLIPV